MEEEGNDCERRRCNEMNKGIDNKELNRKEKESQGGIWKIVMGSANLENGREEEYVR